MPFEMAAAIGALTSLDFLGLGVPPGTPSLGELLNQGKDNLDAWWISLSTFGVLVVMLLLLILIGDALRDALDPRKVLEGDVGIGVSRVTSLLEVRAEPRVDRLRRAPRGGPRVVHARRRREARAGGRIGLGQDRHRAVHACA